MSSLADSIIEEKIDVVLDYLRRGVNINDHDEYGFTPLIEAAVADNVDIAKLLMEYGADVNLQDETGGTALHWAVENNNEGLCRLLLEKGANPNSYTFAGQPVLVMAMLRQNQSIKKILLQQGASLEFAQDYINGKLLGHMFELVGTAHIIDPKNNFVEIDFEGFYLEVTLALIAESLEQFKGHFAARALRKYSQYSNKMVEVLHRAARLIKFQQYRIDIQTHKNEIDALLEEDLFIIPVGYEGHAITFVKFGNIFVKCDRREDSRLYDNVFFYHIENPTILTKPFIKNLIFEKQTSDYINEILPQLLNLKPLTELKVTAQISGNCSWANVEACIPVLLFLMFSQKTDFQENISRYKNIALNFFQQWREWNKTRALNFCMQSLRESDSIRRLCKAEILAAILYQSFKEESSITVERIETILSILMTPEYKAILQNYVKIYCYESQSEEGVSFLRLLRGYGYTEK